MTRAWVAYVGVFITFGVTKVQGQDSLDGNWRATIDAAGFIRFTVSGTTVKDTTSNYQGTISLSSGSFTIVHPPYGGGSATYTWDRITWASGAIYVRSEAITANTTTTTNVTTTTQALCTGTDYTSQCWGLAKYIGAATWQACQAECCQSSTCQVWQFTKKDCWMGLGNQGCSGGKTFPFGGRKAYSCCAGGGMDCATCVPQSQRTSNCHCSTCNFGYYNPGTSGCQAKPSAMTTTTATTISTTTTTATTTIATTATTSTTTTTIITATTATTIVDSVVEGSMTLKITNATQFINEPNVTAVLAIAIAEMFEVNVSWIRNVTATLARRLQPRVDRNYARTMRMPGRGLSGTAPAMKLTTKRGVIIQFYIRIPPVGMAQITATILASRFNALTIQEASSIVNRVVKSGCLGQPYNSEVRYKFALATQPPAVQAPARRKSTVGKSTTKLIATVALAVLVPCVLICVICCRLRKRSRSRQCLESTGLFPSEFASPEIVWSVSKLLQPPDVISSDLHVSLINHLSALFNSIEAVETQVFLTFAAGQRTLDVTGSVPGWFFAAAVTKRLVHHGIRCRGNVPKLAMACEDYVTNMLAKKDTDIKVILVLETRAVYSSRHCLNELYAGLQNNIEIILLRLEQDIPVAQDRWPQFNLLPEHSATEPGSLWSGKDDQDSNIYTNASDPRVQTSDSFWAEKRTYVTNMLCLVTPQPLTMHIEALDNLALDLKFKLSSLHSHPNASRHEQNEDSVLVFGQSCQREAECFDPRHQKGIPGDSRLCESAKRGRKKKPTKGSGGQKDSPRCDAVESKRGELRLPDRGLSANLPTLVGKPMQVTVAASKSAVTSPTTTFPSQSEQSRLPVPPNGIVRSQSSNHSAQTSASQSTSYQKPKDAFRSERSTPPTRKTVTQNASCSRRHDASQNRSCSAEEKSSVNSPTPDVARQKASASRRPIRTRVRQDDKTPAKTLATQQQKQRRKIADQNASSRRHDP